jgi:hypothetical protein
MACTHFSFANSTIKMTVLGGEPDQHYHADLTIEVERQAADDH